MPSTTPLRERLALLVRKKRIKPKDLARLATPADDPWEATRGLLKGRISALLKHQRALRAEWDR